MTANEAREVAIKHCEELYPDFFAFHLKELKPGDHGGWLVEIRAKTEPSSYSPVCVNLTLNADGSIQDTKVSGTGI